jgi:hypothetical protein
MRFTQMGQENKKNIYKQKSDNVVRSNISQVG